MNLLDTRANLSPSPPTCRADCWNGLALNWAAKGGHTDVVEMLLSWHTSAWGAKALAAAAAVAAGAPHPAIVEMLEAAAGRCGPAECAEPASA